MDETRTIICDYCRKSVPVADVKMVALSDEKIATLCSICRAKQKIAAKKPIIKNDEPKKQLFFCTRCRYKFKFNKESASNLRCPYCGNSDKVIEYKVPSVDQLIKSADRE